MYQEECPRCRSTSKAVKVHVFPREDEPKPERPDQTMINCPDIWHVESLESD